MGKKKQEAEALNELRALYLKHHRKKYPSIPEYARCAPRYSDKTANGLTKCVIDFIRLTGGQAERISTTGRLVDRRQQFTDVCGRTREIGRTQWIPTSGTKGSADVSAVIAGRAVKIEIKMKDQQSEEQKQYQEQVEQAGGIYIITRSFSDFLGQYKHIKA